MFDATVRLIVERGVDNTRLTDVGIEAEIWLPDSLPGTLLSGPVIVTAPLSLIVILIDRVIVAACPTTTKTLSLRPE